MRIKNLGAMVLAATMAITMAMPASAKVYSGRGVYDIDRSGTATINEKGNVEYKYTSEVYKNRITGQTWDSSVRDKDAQWASQHYVADVKKLSIGIDEYQTFDIKLIGGDVLGKVKVASGKKNITIALEAKSEEDVFPKYDYKTKEVYFENEEERTKKVIATSEDYPTDEQMNAWKSKEATYTYRIFGKKTGAAKIQYTLNGKKHTVKVNVSNDARVFRNVTYAGKSLTFDASKTGTNANILYAQTANKEGIPYTTKKSGKFSVKMGKNYKFVKMFVVKPTPYETKTTTTENSYSKSTSSYLQRQITTGADLNGDGDTLDRVYGIDETDFKDSVVQTINKKSAKIKLNTSAFQRNDNSTLTYKDDNTTISKTSYSKSNLAETSVYVVYQNKITKQYSYDEFPIYLRVSKK
ncbi:MAG: hypothetical protein E7301_13760 [Butyrivibrio sp.]|nr:hypothetical protein [Butyrivibrio sp.]